MKLRISKFNWRCEQDSQAVPYRFAREKNYRRGFAKNSKTRAVGSQTLIGKATVTKKLENKKKESGLQKIHWST